MNWVGLGFQKSIKFVGKTPEKYIESKIEKPKFALVLTDLDSLIRNTQCGNLKRFLLLRFTERKLPFWPFEQLWISIFFENWHFQVCNISKNENLEPSKLLKRQFLTFRNQPKLISRKFRVAEKWLNFHTVVCRIPTVKNPT